MKVTIQYFDGCAGWTVARERVQAALEQLGRENVVLDLQRVESPEEAQQIRFRGSPTILVDGVDPFEAEADPVGFSCRVYRTEDGQQDSPTVAQLVRALDT